jgi:hypothetical protein
LKTRKIQEAKESAHKSRIRKVLAGLFTWILHFMSLDLSSFYQFEWLFMCNVLQILVWIEFNLNNCSCIQVVIRVRFPDKDTLEVAFPSSEKIQSLLNLLKKVVARPELPFYICKQEKGQVLFVYKRLKFSLVYLCCVVKGDFRSWRSWHSFTLLLPPLHRS